MIRVPGDNPTTVSFVQKGVEKANGRIASEQVAKAASAEVIARTEFENAHYRLTKATEALSATEISYHEAVAKSAWNKEQVRSSYNNALAGFRDADKTAEIAAEKFALAKDALAGLRLVAKAEISNGEELKAACAAAKSDEEKVACVAAAKKLKLPFFLPKGWAAEYAPSEKGEVAKAGISNGDSLKEAVKNAKTPEDRKACVVAAEKMKLLFLLPKGWKAEADKMEKSTFSPPLEVVGKSFTTNPIMKEVVMPDAKILVICPECGGDGPMTCPCCSGERLVSEEVHDEAMGYGNANCSMCGGGDADCPMCGGGMMMKSANPFSTKSLLTRDFQKSAGYQNYIFTKGGPGSGAQPGHEFHGNQHTGGMSSGGRLIHEREGHKVTQGRYERTAKENGERATDLWAKSFEHELKGETAKAAEALREAEKAHKMAAGAHEGIAGIHGKVRGDEDARRASRAEAASQRARGARAGDEAARLEAMAA